MPRASRNKLSPWIEQLILNYDSQAGNRGSGRLKAHVIGVGQMSSSQARSSEDPTGLLFLSDGVLQIPAVLTASAWEHLQEQEDRECFTSLVNTTVCIQDYQLQFHMAPEQTKCRFFVLVGELATTAAGPVKDSTPCCTTLPSVRLEIVKTWRALLGVQDSQRSQGGGFDLSELLGEWQHDCLQAVLQDVRDMLMAGSGPVSPRPSTSTFTPAQTHSDTFTTTSWDVDRVRYKGEKIFSVPIKCLLMPEEEALQLQTPSNVGGGTESGHSATSDERKTSLPQICTPSDSTPASVDDAEWRIAMPAAAERDCKFNSPPHVEDCTLHEDMVAGMIDSNIRPLSNPWDIFPPPCDTSSSSDSSPKAMPNPSLDKPATATPELNRGAILTSTQLPVSSKEFQQTSERSFLPPYQKPESSNSPSGTAVSSASTGERSTSAAGQSIPVMEQECEISVKDMERTHRKAKRKRSEPTSEQLAALVEEEALVPGSPPSWLFDTHFVHKENSRHIPCETAEAASRKTSTVHSDGRPFSYSYQVSGQNQQDFSQFRVEESFLQWAIKILVVPEQTERPESTSVSSNQTSARNKVT